MGLNKQNTEHLLYQVSPKYRQYQPGIRPSHRNIKTNKKTTYITTKTPLPAI